MADPIRIQRYLSMAGRASRREAERLLVAGRIRVNGQVVTELGVRVDPDKDRVEVDGESVEVGEVRWIAFHKPPGVLTTRSDPHAERTVFDVLGPQAGGLRYVGRLDRDTEGLLLLSNEGEVIHGLTHPSREVEREYRATVAGTPDDEALRRLRSGVKLEDGPAKARRADLAGTEGEDGLVTLVLTEGRKREVRRMLWAVGHPVRRLVRVRFGPIELGELPRGAWRPLTNDDVSRLRALAGRRPESKGRRDGA